MARLLLLAGVLLLLGACKTPLTFRLGTVDVRCEYPATAKPAPGSECPASKEERPHASDR
jgi:hypothetical protein